MIHSLDEQMDEVIAYFSERASRTKARDRKLMLEHLREIAIATQQNMRMIDVLKQELESVHNALGVR